MSIRPLISLVTLGVGDVEQSTRFYERLGWRRSSASVPGTSFIALDGVVLSLFGRQDLADDAGVPAGPGGFSGVTLALNQPGRPEVDRVLREAVSAGARLVKPAQELVWGGYGGYFADPDGHLWEVAHNPFWPLDADGRIVLPT
jgi:catechol 2,3-dioxygenase-like lactoylglutathione lyase family enzyme